mgnify:FL=1
MNKFYNIFKLPDGSLKWVEIKEEEYKTKELNPKDNEGIWNFSFGCDEFNKPDFINKPSGTTTIK